VAFLFKVHAQEHWRVLLHQDPLTILHSPVALKNCMALVKKRYLCSRFQHSISPLSTEWHIAQLMCNWSFSVTKNQTTLQASRRKWGRLLSAGAAQHHPMGWNSWQFFSLTDVDEANSVDWFQPRPIVDSGLAKIGYQYINIDDGLVGLNVVRGPTAKTRDPKPALFPSAKMDQSSGQWNQLPNHFCTSAFHCYGAQKPGIYTACMDVMPVFTKLIGLTLVLIFCQKVKRLKGKWVTMVPRWQGHQTVFLLTGVLTYN